MAIFKQQISRREYISTKPEYIKECMIICPNRAYIENDPYRLIDGEFFIGADAYWELLHNNIELYYGNVYYFRNNVIKEDFKVTISDKEFVPE